MRENRPLIERLEKKDREQITLQGKNATNGISWWHRNPQKKIQEDRGKKFDTLLIWMNL